MPSNDMYVHAQKVKPQFYREAVALDEVYQRLLNEEEVKKKKHRGKRRKLMKEREKQKKDEREGESQIKGKEGIGSKEKER